MRVDTIGGSPAGHPAVTADSYTITHCIMVIHAQRLTDQLDWEELLHDGFTHADTLWAAKDGGWV